MNPVGSMSLGSPKTGQEIWNKLNAVLDSRLTEYYSVVGDAHNLFGEATAAFDAGAIEGAALICRATVEAACYLFLATKQSDEGIVLEYPYTLDGIVRQVRFDELRRAIIKRGILSKRQIAAIKRIQENGNLIAHLASSHAGQIEAFEREAQRFNLEIEPRNDLTQEQRIREEMKVQSKLRFWLSKEEVLDDLIDAASILMTLGLSQDFPKAGLR